MDLQEQHVPGGQHTTPGQTLRAAREAGGMSVADVAQALKLSPRQVEAIESDDYERLSGPTFVRGFVRNYARLMRLDAAELVAGLDAKASTPVAELHVPEIEGVRMPSGAERTTRVWTAASLIAGVLLVIALILYFDLVDVSPLLNGGATRTVVVPPAAPEAVESDGTPATLVAPVQETPAQQEPADASPVIDSRPPADALPAEADPAMRRLVFTFEGPSWVEVKDSSGQVLLSQLNPAGSQRVVEGRAPLSLIIGNAGTVRLEADTRPVDLKPHTRVEVARLTIP